MIEAKLLSSLASMNPATGTQKKKRRVCDPETGIPVLGSGVSGLALVSAPDKGSEMWNVRYRTGGYQFRLGLRNRILAGYVARLIYAAAGPRPIPEDLAVNNTCEHPAPETLYGKYRTSVFQLRMPDEKSIRDDAPELIIVDDWVADNIRGYSWFECRQPGLPDSWAIRPVVSVNRDRRLISVSWVTIESEVMGLSTRPPTRGSCKASVGINRDGMMYADLRQGRERVGPIKRASGMAKTGYKRRRGKGVSGMARSRHQDTNEYTEKTGIRGAQRIQKIMRGTTLTVVDNEVIPGFPIRSRTITCVENWTFGK